MQPSEYGREPAANPVGRGTFEGVAVTGIISMDIQTLLNNGLSNLRAGRLAEAEREFLEVLRRDMHHFSTLNLLSVVLMQQKKFADAQRYMKVAYALRPKDVTVVYNYGILLQVLGKHSDALNRFDEAADLKPDDAEIWNNRGTALCALGRYYEALVSYEKAIVIRPNYADAHGNLAITLHEIGRYGEALGAYDRVIALEPHNLNAYKNRGHTLLTCGRNGEALASFDKAIAIMPHDAQAHYGRGNVLRALNRRDEALASYDKAIVLAPDFAEAFIDRCVTLKELGRNIDQTVAADLWFTCPMNGQAARVDMVGQLIRQCGIERIVETGTFLGTTTEYFAGFNLPVTTAEANPSFASRAKRRLYRWSNIDLRAQDSVRVLTDLVCEPIDRSVPTLFYLDAHWSEHLPLRDEVEIAVAHFPKALFVIDDFAVPDDPGYGFDDYGPGKRIDLGYLLQGRMDLAVFFPSVPSHDETGAKRGCVVATKNKELAQILERHPLLRHWRN